jgi:hypothetical protein
MLLENADSVEPKCSFPCVKSAGTNIEYAGHKGKIQEAERAKLLWGQWCVSAG